MEDNLTHLKTEFRANLIPLLFVIAIFVLMIIAIALFELEQSITFSGTVLSSGIGSVTHIG